MSINWYTVGVGLGVAIASYGLGTRTLMSLLKGILFCGVEITWFAVSMLIVGGLPILGIYGSYLFVGWCLENGYMHKL